MSAAFDEYVIVFRGATEVTLYCIAGFVGFLLLWQVLYSVMCLVLKKVNAVKINRKKWYVEVDHESNPDEEFENEEKLAIHKMIKICEKNYGEEVSMRFQRILKAIEKLKPEFQFSTPSQLFTEIQKYESNVIPTNRPDDARFGRVRKNVLQKMSSVAGMEDTDTARPSGITRESSSTPLRDSTSTEMMTMVRNQDGTVSVVEDTPYSADGSDTDEGTTPKGEAGNTPASAPPSPSAPEIQSSENASNNNNNNNNNSELKKQASSTAIKDKIYAINMLALQAEEFLQWLYHQFGEAIPGLDDAGLRRKVQMIRMIPHHVAIFKNLVVLEEMMLQLLEQFKKPTLVTRNRSLSIALGL